MEAPSRFNLLIKNLPFYHFHRKAHPVYLSKRMDPSERNLLLYSYFANRLGPAFEKRYYNNKQMEDLYEIEKRNFDEIDGSAFSPFKRQNIRH